MSLDLAYKLSSLEEISAFVEKYVENLSSPIDSFLEEHILNSKIYTIEIDSERAGYFAVHENTLLTQFYIDKNWLKHAQPVFADVICKHKISAAYVPTCDELMMSLSMDIHTRVEKQAYFFQDAEINHVNQSLSVNGIFKVANEGDIHKIIEGTGDFFDKLEQHVSHGEIFVYMDGEQLLGAGIIEPGVLLRNCTSIGMITCERFRRQGIGRFIIEQLKDWCYRKGTTPIAGCWYYNTNSKKTLEGAGMVTKTRLLKVLFNA